MSKNLTCIITVYNVSQEKLAHSGLLGCSFLLSALLIKNVMNKECIVTVLDCISNDKIMHVAKFHHII